MKTFLQRLLVILALGLCGLCTWQWLNQARQHQAMTALAQTNANQAGEIQHDTNSIAAMDRQIAQMDVHLTELKSALQTNRVELLSLHAESNRLAGTVAQYQAATTTLQAQVKQVVVQRDELLQRLNEAIKDRNETVTKYNALIKRWEERTAPPAAP